MKCLKTLELFDLSYSAAGKYLENTTYPFEILKSIGDIILEIGSSLNPADFDKIGENVWISKEAKVAPTAYINGPCIIDSGTEVRHCAFIRGNALIGKGCVIGNSTELKNVIIFDSVQVPHYNYVGDSVLGYKSHMGAGSITSNVKSDKSLVVIKTDEEKIETGLKKVGAFLGDFVEIGCGSVLNPGTVIGKGASVYPLSSVRGSIPENGIYKKQGEIAQRI
jgi:NDP-sugar pyrophosphorylase family protein